MINKMYNESSVREDIKLTLKQQGAITLIDFLDEETIKELREKVFPWKKQYNPLRYSFKEGDFKVSEITEEVIEFIEELIKKKVKVGSVKVCLFENKDYTLLTDNSFEEEGFTLILELNEYWRKDWGGFTSFIKENEEIQRMYPIPNSLSVIQTSKAMKSFVKYINHHATSKRIFIEWKLK